MWSGKIRTALQPHATRTLRLLVLWNMDGSFGCLVSGRRSRASARRLDGNLRTLGPDPLSLEETRNGRPQTRTADVNQRPGWQNLFQMVHQAAALVLTAR